MPAMATLPHDDPLATAVSAAIRTGDQTALRRLLQDHPELATTRIAGQEGGEECSRTLLHIVTDWPGHHPNVRETIETLVGAGAYVDASFVGSHTETPLHWAASSDDIAALDALLDAGADIEASGAVIAGGTPLDDAVAFGQWHVAHRLVARGARTALWHAAALGLMDRIEHHFTDPATVAAPHPWGIRPGVEPPDELTVAFWCACHGSQHQAAEYLLHRGANINWIAVWDRHTPLDAAQRVADGILSTASPANHAQAEELIAWLRAQGAKPASELI
jgi:uncharacterized protein